MKVDCLKATVEIVTQKSFNGDVLEVARLMAGIYGKMS